MIYLHIHSYIHITCLLTSSCRCMCLQLFLSEMTTFSSSLKGLESEGASRISSFVTTLKAKQTRD